MVVQFYYLNNLDEFTISNGSYIILNQKLLRYDCIECIPDIAACHKNATSMIFHLTQSNHFAIDSMIYDGKTKALVLIQITLNPQHKIPFQQINNFITGEKNKQKIGRIKKQNEEKKEKDDKKKYYNFFKEMREKHLVDRYYFQWLTPDRIQTLIDRIEKKENKIKNLAFINIPYYDRLIDQIQKEKRL